MYTLKRIFAPKYKNGETIDNYLDLIYGPLTDSTEEDSDSSFISDDDSIPTAGNQKYCHIIKKTKNCEIEDTNQVKYLPPTDTTNLIQKVCAAIYLFLDKLWQIPTESLLTNLYSQLKQDMIVSNQAEKTIETSLVEEDDDIFTEMWTNNRSENIVQTEDEII
ncbi:2677_t:CDS:2, partial [Cetraspora pellucida]